MLFQMVRHHYMRKRFGAESIGSYLAVPEPCDERQRAAAYIGHFAYLMSDKRAYVFIVLCAVFELWAFYRDVVAYRFAYGFFSGCIRYLDP